MKTGGGKWKRVIEFIRFGIVGGSMTVLNFGLYVLMNEKLGFFYMFSNVLSYGIAVVLSYFLNLRFTFKKKTSGSREFIQYIAMRIVFLGIDSAALFLFVEELCIDKYISKIAITFILMILTYSFSRKIFRQDNEGSAPDKRMRSLL